MKPASPLNSQKENVRVKPLRVTWSQQYRKYPNGSPAPRPLKSILKNRVNRPLFMMPQSVQAELPAVEVNHMQSATYLKSPIETLLESTQIDSSDYVSQHDLLEAYNTLQTRIRSQIQVICQSDQDLVAWNAVKLSSSQVLQVLRRDIRRALGPPFPQKKSSFGASLLSNKLEMTADDIKTATDLSLVCHQSLRLLSDLFRFPALYSIFSTNDLDNLLDDLLTISLARSLPTHNSRKTHALVIWIIQIQRLPAVVLAPKKREISSALKRAVAGNFDEDGKSNVISDGLEAVYDFLRYHPSLFLSPLSELLPSILSHILSPSFDVRLHATRALNGFVLAKINTPLSISGHINDSISRHISSFIATQSSKRISARSDVRLSTLIAAALAVNKPSHSGNGPAWVLTVLASLIVLSDYSLFSHPHALRLFFPSLAQAQTHKCNGVQRLIPHVWKCFIWAFLRISTGRGPSQGETSDISPVRPSVDLEERAFLVVKQELRGGIGVALTASLLGQSEFYQSNAELKSGGSWTVKALTVVNDMVCSGNKSVQSEGLSLLTRLVNAVGSPYALNMKEDAWNNKILAQSLFDGTILSARWEHLSAAVCTIHDFKIDEVRQLSESEIVEHWDTLISIWTKCAEEYLQDTAQFSANLVEIWQSLLLVQAQLTQGNCHLTSPQAFTKRIASLLSRFFFPISRGTRVIGVEQQFRQLSLVTQLWKVTKNVFVPAWLPAPAESIIRAILKRSFDLSDTNVQSAWCKVCSNLVAAGIPGLRELLIVHDEHEANLEAKRLLWTVLAETLQSSGDKFTWQDAASFLDISFGAWTMSDYEFELWDCMLRCVVTRAGSVNIRPTAVIEHMVERLGTKKVKWLSSSPKVALLLFSHVNLGVNDAAPMHCFALIDSALYDLYPPHPDLLYTALQLLRLLRDVITSASSSLIVTILVAFRRSLSRWIEDRSEVVAEEEYNDVIIPLYCDSLSILRHQVPSVEVLEALTSFFIAGFVRIPPPSLGPLAFRTFWRATYHGLEQFYHAYSDSLKDYLKVVDDVYGGEGNLRAGLSLDPDSQLTPSSVAPDSQCGSGTNTYDYDNDRSRRPYLDEDIVDATRRNGNDSDSPTLSHSVLQHPLARIRSASPEIPFPPQLAALARLREYSSHLGDNSSRTTPANGSHSSRGRDDTQPSSHSSNSPRVRRGQPALLPSRLAPAFSLGSKVFKLDTDLKRAADVSAKPTKRRKTDPEAEAVSSKESNKEVTTIVEDGAGLQDPRRTTSLRPLRQNGKKSASEPITRATSPVHYTQPTSQPNASRKRMLFDYVELLTYQQVLKHERRPQKSESAVRRWSASNRTDTPTLLRDDYDSWETSLSTPALRHLHRELVQAASKTDIAEKLHGGRSPGHRGTELVVDKPDILDSPSLGLIAKRKKRRTQTAPVPFRPSQAVALRRSKTTSVRLDALEQAYTIVANEASPIPVEDLLQATRLVRQIGTTLAEQMSRALGDIAR